MDVTSYPPPVDKLLTLGDGRKVGTNVKVALLDHAFA